MLSNTYGEDVTREWASRECFHGFENDDFYVEDRHCGGLEKILEDTELETILNENSSQSQILAH